MTLNEYYNFSEDANVSLRYTSFFDEQPDNFPCPSNMSNAFTEQKNRFAFKYLNTSNVTDMSYMFRSCINLTTIPLIDTSNVTTMKYMFYYCESLVTIPELDTSNVTNMERMFTECDKLTSIPLIDTSNVTTMYYMFDNCIKLETIPELDTSNVTTMEYMFNNCTNLTSIPPLNCQNIKTKNCYPLYKSSNYEYLTDIGGFIDMKMSWDNNYGLYRCPNLTYESCINILNGLYDFVGNNITPNSNQGKLKVHQNFINLVGDEISIGTNKGWTITA